MKQPNSDPMQGGRIACLGHNTCLSKRSHQHYYNMHGHLDRWCSQKSTALFYNFQSCHLRNNLSCTVLLCSRRFQQPTAGRNRCSRLRLRIPLWLSQDYKGHHSCYNWEHRLRLLRSTTQYHYHNHCTSHQNSNGHETCNQGMHQNSHRHNQRNLLACMVHRI